MNSGFFWRVFAGTVAAVLLTGFVVDLSVVDRTRVSLTEEIERRVSEEVVLVRSIAESGIYLGPDGTPRLRPNALERVAADLPTARVTLISRSGVVLFDSHEEPATMDNHGTRPEVLALGTTVTRYSNTLMRSMTYCALPIHSQEGNSVMAYARVAVPTDYVEKGVANLRSGIRTSVFFGCAIGLVFALLFAGHVTRPLREIASLVSAIGHGASSRRLPVRGTGEIPELARKINGMVDELEVRLDRLRRDRAEKQAILAGMVEGLLVVDREAAIILANDAACTFLGLNHDEAVGRSLWELARTDEFASTAIGCMRDGSVTHSEITTETVNGEFTLALSSAALAHGGAAPHACVLVLHDITELRRLETMRRDFVANVSHELKTPLTVMRGYLEALFDEPDMDVAQRAVFIERAKVNTERLTAIVTDLLSLARYEAGEPLRNQESVQLDTLLSESVSIAKQSAEARQITIDLEIESVLPPVHGSRDGLLTSVGNLLSNAIRYSPEGSHVTINLTGDSNQAHIVVRDEGPGIPAHEQERIFERFYRVDRNRSRELGGTGLGLAIVRHVASAHGGRAWVESEIGHGSAFHLTIPYAT